MDLEAEVEALKRQNRRLKAALFSTLTGLLIGIVVAAGITGVATIRARAQVLRAIEMEKQARERAKAALEKTQQGLEEYEAQEKLRRAGQGEP